MRGAPPAPRRSFTLTKFPVTGTVSAVGPTVGVATARPRRCVVLGRGGARRIRARAGASGFDRRGSSEGRALVDRRTPAGRAARRSARLLGRREGRRIRVRRTQSRARPGRWLSDCCRQGQVRVQLRGAVDHRVEGMAHPATAQEHPLRQGSDRRPEQGRLQAGVSGHRVTDPATAPVPLPGSGAAETRPTAVGRPVGIEGARRRARRDSVASRIPAEYCPSDIFQPGRATASVKIRFRSSFGERCWHELSAEQHCRVHP